jgi:2-methylisocitrate lyase-like PEP mutase family enzyme
MLNMVLGGKTPIVDATAAVGIGFSLILYANAALQGAIDGMQRALKALRKTGVLGESAVASFAERQRLVGKASFDAMELRYAAGATTA